ncbi:gliding motility lipoprotein GldD [Pseudofulvibacter geojedonensis]|uniref:Gliding motility lipoprotein GldD n=1 Tax=Pseudofulvibacter geojedonensis TaxID=1123758 RepID=A0ABW3I4M0_9FLAO
MVLLLGFVSCNEDVLPKPKGYLSLEYPKPMYAEMKSTCPYTFEKNIHAEIEAPKWKSYCGLNLNYPKLKGKIHITYSPINNNLKMLLRDAQNLTQEHTVKADGIVTIPYENKKQRAYGMVYDVEGDAASALQFYVTDSVNHFLSGSIHFHAKPNYDSILPASDYLKKDVKILMESLKWKE